MTPAEPERRLQPLLHDLAPTVLAPTCALGGPDGQLRAAGVQGVFHADTRVLSQALLRVDVNGTNATKGDQFALGTRIRELEEGPDGSIYLLTDGQRGADGKLLKLTPTG